MPELYENVKKLAEEQRLSIQAIETGAGLANGTIGGWKNGSKPRLESVVKVATVLGATVDELIQKDS